MKQYSSKNKIIVLCLVWLVLIFAMFGYFFKILDNSNQITLSAMAKDRSDLAVLQAQNNSYIQAQADLKKLEAQSLQPSDFFSSDISLVNEIRTLEGLAKRFNVQMTLSGVSGTVDTAPKAGTVSSLVVIPYSIGLTGDFFSAVNFIETLEHLSFITNVTSLSIAAGDKNNVSVGLTASFYLKK